MLLSVRERFVLWEMLPTAERVTTMKVVRKAREALGFSEAEIKEFGIVSTEGGSTWKDGKDCDVTLSPAACEIIKAALLKRDEAGTVTGDDLSLYEKFMPEAFA